MTDGSEKKLILGYVSDLKQPLRKLSEVESGNVAAPPESSMVETKSHPYERRAPATRRDRELDGKRRRKEESVQ
jgi:hypothetical protein